MATQISTRSKLLILTAVMASLLEIIDTSIVNVAIPTMMGNLGATLDEISWVITGYIIANAIVLPIASWMSEQLGRKFYYTGCIILFTVASVACGLAPNLPILVLFRVVQGFAGGALLPTSQSIIYEAFPKEKAGMASAIYGMSVMIGPTVGPTLGGYLTDTLGWRSIFNVNLPIGIVVAILSYILVEDVGFDPAAKKEAPVPGAVKHKRERTPVDVWGLLFLIVGVGSLQFVLERGNAEDWFSSKIIIATTFSAIASITLLIWWELRTKHPILVLKHFLNPTFRSGVMLMAGLGAMLYGIIFMIPVFSNIVLGLTATQTGELFIPGALLAATMMPLIGMQLRKRDPRLLIGIGVIGLSMAIVLISGFNSQTSADGMFWPLLLRGAAMSFLFVPINTVVLMQFSGVAVGEAAGMMNLCRQLGGSIFIAVLSTLLARYQNSNYVVLKTYVSLLSPAAQTANHALMGVMHYRMDLHTGMGTTAAAAAKALYFRVKKESFILAYRHVMLVGVTCFSFCLIPLMLMKPKKLAITGDLPSGH